MNSFKVENPLLSVAIPAFNNPKYTKKAIYSVYEQSYRPIEIILSDDNSPNSLEYLAAIAIADCPEQVKLKYIRQETNLGHYWNMKACLEAASGEFLILLDHDDHLIDVHFLEAAITTIRSNSGCYVSIFNNIVEGSNQTVFPNLSPKLQRVSGESLINLIFQSIGSGPNKCAVVYDFNKLKELGYLKFFVERSVCMEFQVKPEDAYLPICLLASCGDASLSGRVVSVRGTPPDRLSGTNEWQRDVGMKHFLPFYLLLKFFQEKSFLAGQMAMQRNIINLIPCEYINVAILKHYDFDIEMVSLMVLSYLVQSRRVGRIGRELPKIFEELRQAGFQNSYAAFTEHLIITGLPTEYRKQ